MYKTKKNLPKAVKKEKDTPPGIFFSGISKESISILNSKFKRLGYSSKARYFDALMKWVATLK